MPLLFTLERIRNLNHFVDVHVYKFVFAITFFSMLYNGIYIHTKKTRPIFMVLYHVSLYCIFRSNLDVAAKIKPKCLSNVQHTKMVI